MTVSHTLLGLAARSFPRRLRQRLPHWLDQRQVSESGVILVTALVVGIGAGLGAVVFRRLIAVVQR